MTAAESRELLERKGVKPTPNRILVLRELTEAPRPLSLADLENAVGFSIDKASIFRVLELFARMDIVHVIEDGSRSVKYELCHAPSRHSIADQHVHFHCERCGETFCLENIKVPLIEIPEGFTPRGVNYMIKGLCPRCTGAADAEPDTRAD